MRPQNKHLKPFKPQILQSDIDLIKSMLSEQKSYGEIFVAVKMKNIMRSDRTIDRWINYVREGRY